MGQYWTVWYPKAGSTGLMFARGMADPTEKMLVHAAPQVLTVELYDGDRNLIASGKDLEATQDSPICLLERNGDEITRKDLWPTDEHLELPLLLPGGEIGILQSWWNSDEQDEWRWQIEFYNSTK